MSEEIIDVKGERVEETPQVSAEEVERQKELDKAMSTYLGGVETVVKQISSLSKNQLKRLLFNYFQYPFFINYEAKPFMNAEEERLFLNLLTIQDAKNKIHVGYQVESHHAMDQAARNLLFEDVKKEQEELNNTTKTVEGES